MNDNRNSLKISIITVCLNRAKFIETAIQSVVAQNHDNLEHIIIDGGSTDGTLEILKKYPHLCVVSGPDAGVYDAFNKGITLAKGQIINFLNSDHRWGEVPLQVIEAEFLCNAALEVITTGAGVYEYGSTEKWVRKKYLPALEGGEQFFDGLKGRGPAVNGWFIRRELFDRIGVFDNSYKVSADYDFCLRAVIMNTLIHPLNIETYHYLAHAHSLTFDNDHEKIASAIIENLSIIENFLSKENIETYQREYLRKRYQSLLLKIIYRKIRLAQPIGIINYISRFFRSIG